ncbi:carboxymuconolactone decarboxylase family protein [Noviherbaspirillum sp. Root189]|uniref:carboxymuconolactone decarboxylase family protein n=1 Tax=Noviherbaspirillum sp. Root189 TaxID=1736487 RepID=UPI0007098CD7|nr:carboxymuconolactone decarboxylase family protein [Noviherbaspirillum sp. Root189]KRB81547.1 4-carboxymuconolactone decarboxylase [Noviherbaspirillum sp. Root189]
MSQIRETGRSILRKVLGEEYFAKRELKENSFNTEFRAITEEYCFGTVWGRPGIDHRTRSLILLGMLTALNKGPELRLHVRGAINNGCSVEEIKEVLLQAAVYCGIPAGVEAFRAAEEVFGELNLIK